MPTTALGIWTPDDTDDWDLTIDQAATAVSIDAAITAYGRGLLSARPAFGSEGRKFYATDTNIEYFDTGAAWIVWNQNWTTYAPTVVNLTGTTTAAYKVSVGEATVYIESTLTATISAQPTYTLPLTASSSTTESLNGVAEMIDISAANTAYTGTVDKISATICRPRSTFTPAGGSASAANVGVASFPFAFVSGDIIRMKFSYRTA